jgi:hypothetical protein
MKKSNLIIILVSVIVLQSILLILFTIQSYRNNNVLDDPNENVTAVLSEKVSISISGGISTSLESGYNADITNNNNKSIKYIKGTILFYDNQKQLIHTVSFEDINLIPGNFTRIHSFSFSISRSVPSYAYYEVVFEEIRPS